MEDGKFVDAKEALWRVAVFEGGGAGVGGLGERNGGMRERGEFEHAVVEDLDKASQAVGAGMEGEG